MNSAERRILYQDVCRVSLAIFVQSMGEARLLSAMCCTGSSEPNAGSASISSSSADGSCAFFGKLRILPVCKECAVSEDAARS